MRKAFRTIWLVLTAPFRFVIWLFKTIARWLSNLISNIYHFFSDELITEEGEGLPETVATVVQNPGSLLEHIDALRKHLFRGLFAVMLTTAGSFLYVRQIMTFLASPLDGGLDMLRAIDVTENIGTVMRVSLLAGFALAFPYLALEIWLFIGPAVSRRARIFGVLAIPIATAFFIGGMAFAYYIMLPVALDFLFNFMGLQTEPRPGSYFNFITSVLFWIGASFEFPLVIYILAGLGFIRAKTLLRQWRLAIVIIAVAAAAITPTIDPVNMALVMAPMILLYFLSIVLASIAQPRLQADSTS